MLIINHTFSTQMMRSRCFRRSRFEKGEERRVIGELGKMKITSLVWLVPVGLILSARTFARSMLWAISTWFGQTGRKGEGDGMSYMSDRSRNKNHLRGVVGVMCFFFFSCIWLIAPLATRQQKWWRTKPSSSSFTRKLQPLGVSAARSSRYSPPLLCQ